MEFVIREEPDQTAVCSGSSLFTKIYLSENLGLLYMSTVLYFIDACNEIRQTRTIFPAGRQTETI